MLNYWQDSFFVLVTVIAALAFMALLNRVWPREKRRSHNDLIGWQVSILGTTYAVILGFMLYTVWTGFGEADLNVDLEANALVNLHALSLGLPEPQRTKLRDLGRSYAETALDRDWPDMAAGQEPRATAAINAEMWNTIMSIKSASPAEATAEDHALSQLSMLTEHRRTRILQSASRLPPVLWWVLMVGGTLTVVSACTFGSDSVGLHAVQVFSFTLLISLCLAAISNINRPFQGVIHIDSYAFRRAQINMSMH